MRPFVANRRVFEAGKAAKLSSAGAQLGEFTTLRLTLAGDILSPFALDAFGFSISATSAPRFLPVAAILWDPDPHFLAMGDPNVHGPPF